MNYRHSLIALLLFIVTGVYAQNTIHGVVTDHEGTPVPGANVVIKGTIQGTVTDLEGNYTLENVSQNSILVYSFIGMLSKEIIVGDKTQVDISLIPDIMDLEGVVVIGYGSVKRKDLTGSVVSANSEDITKLPTSSPIEALQGKVTGMDIVRESGSAGSGVKVLIRGTRSITGDNEPLYIVDGIQGASISDLNPGDIESINVLKDASATAIYGSQGANGVVVITTKKGKSGQSKISYSGYFGINGFTSYPKVRMGEDYIEFRKEAYRSTGAWNDDVNTEADYNLLFSSWELDAIDSNQWVDWQDLLINNSTQQNHQISYSSGNDKSTSYLSVGYFNEKGVIKSDEMTRYTARLNIEHKASKWISMGLQSQIAYTDQDRRKDPLGKANSIAPFGKAYDDNGNINFHPVFSMGSIISPLADERPYTSADNTIRTNGLVNGFLELNPVKGLTYRSNFGANINFSRRGKYNDETSLTQEGTGYSAASIESSNNRYINWDNIVTYSKRIKEHSLSITALTSYVQKIYDYSYASGIGQISANSLFYKLNATETDGRSIESGYTKSNSMSYASRLNYSFRDKYLVSVTERVDGASVLTDKNKWDHFPSVSVAWKMNEENFIRNIPAISNLKIRTSYGVSGNSGIDPYGTQSGIWPFSIGFGEEANTAYKFNNTIGNATLGWEKSTTVNLGLDIGLLNNRINATIDLYNTKTNDILLKRDLPKMTGESNVYQNIGKSGNKGVEILINTLNVQQNDFTWSSTLTFSKNDEEITALIDGQDIIQREDNSLFIGYPIKTFYAFNKLGIWQLGEEDEMSVYNYPIKVGDIKLEDINNDSIIDATDRKVLGAATPKWVAGLENTFSYKSFELSIYLFARWGQMIDMEVLGRYNPSGTGNGPAFLNYWTPENPTNDFPRPRQGTAISNYWGYQALSFVDGSYFKIKNIRLSYTLPKAWTENIKLQRLQCYISVTNLFTITKSHLVKYYDPERGGSESAPLSKQIVFGINVDF
jgi:TonB-linked SusC/RagA family outer membrane protein